MRKQTIQTLLLVGATASMAFFVFKLYKTVKKVKSEIALQEGLDIPQVNTLEDIKKPVTSVFKASEGIPEPIIEEEEDSLEYLDESVIYYNAQDDTDEYVDSYEEGDDEKLRYEANSPEALNQYFEMIQADVTDGYTKRLIWRLFNKPLKLTKQDNHIYNSLMSNRELFFGNSSVHVTQATPSAGELVLYFAKLADFDMDGGVDYWCKVLLYENMEIYPDSTDEVIDEKLYNLYHHTLATDSGFGMFGLNQLEYSNMITNKTNRTSTRITLMMQYHEMVKSFLETTGGPYDE